MPPYYRGTSERYVRLVLLDVTDAEAQEFFDRAHGCDLELELGNGGTYAARVETNVPTRPGRGVSE